MEQLLVEHVCRGEWLNLTAKGEVIDEAAMRWWGETRTCRATVIRDILRGRLALDPDPHGLRLRGTRISGQLDLENLSTDVNLELRDCLLEDGVLARDARLAAVRPGRSCTVIQQVTVGLDLNLPAGTSIARANCDLTKNSASATAAWLSAVGWVLRLAAWVFAALFIAGFTSAVRKT